MLDSGTKRRIDTARDILVGKVPDPKSQVEQITIALIYKFMNDMDAEAEEMGGQRRFFSGDFEKYGWSKIMAPGMGGHEVLNLYAEAIAKMNEYVNIPPLFREIFKNAYLPYRDPETLKSFLKVINDFEYDHSERLGDAFEYLLSVLGSQGEAGQFRTPRHIIDFMVAVIEPQKNETLLDPACGTAGFLISAYKHILKENSSNYGKDKDPYAFELHGVKLEEITADTGKKYKGDKLTPDERNRLINNICGYDISPDMVRLSLVNLYLHGFPDPHIYEYDTLTSEDRWNEYYDIILANPPFMSPKGGIRPHKRFSIDSNRSEVLFADYMAEHLTPNGRCAVVVPEGVVFQTGTAYKSLRKMLVNENYLVGVISLPAGVFNPYSGVKTSILWLDKSLAKKTDKILFVKIENDGFDLGAQRRPIKQNDLPQAFQQIAKYKEAILNGERFESKDNPNLILVEKNRIGDNSDFNLSAERYKQSIAFYSAFPFVELGNEDLFVIEGGGTPSSVDDECWDGNIKWVTLVDLPASNLITEITDSERKITDKGLKSSSAKIIPANSVIVSSRATIGRIGINKVDLATNQGFKNILIKDFNKVSPKYLALMLTKQVSQMDRLASGGTFKEISKTNFKTIQIPLPPLSVQEEIVAELESYQKIIDGARQVVGNYKPRIDIDPEWPMVELGEICDLIGGGTPSKQEKSFWENGSIKWISSKHINDNGQVTDYELITEKAIKNSSTKIVPKGSTIAITRVSVGKIAYADDNYAVNQDLTGLKIKNINKIDEKYLFYSSLTLGPIIDKNAQGLGVRGINRDFLSSLKIPLPDLQTQQQIVAQIEREQEFVKANRQLIEIFEQKIKDRIAKVWGD